jgi:sirohydrochlorin ferrochelatase
VAGALGPDAELSTAAEELVARAGLAPDPSTALVLFAGGSSDRNAITAIADELGAHARPGWGSWAVAALAGGETIGDVVARLRQGGAERVLVVTYMVAEGVLRDRMVEQSEAAGATVVPGTLGETDALADLVVRRAREAAPGNLPE